MTKILRVWRNECDPLFAPHKYFSCTSAVDVFFLDGFVSNDFQYFFIYFGQTRNFPYFYKIPIPTYIFSVVNWDSRIVKRFRRFGLSPGYHRGVLLKQSDVVKLPCCWENPDFFQQMQLRDITGDWLVKRQKWQQTIWLDRFLGVQTTKENRSPQVCWKTACVYDVWETDEFNFMTKKHFWLVKCCVVQLEISICHWFVRLKLSCWK